MDNFHIDITASGRDHFELAMRLAIRDGGFSIREYAVVQRRKLILFRFDPPRNRSFQIRQMPCPMRADDMIEFAWAWLQSGDCDYGTRPIHDGEVSRGFRVYTDEHGFVDGMWQAFAAVQPKWGLHHTATLAR